MAPEARRRTAIASSTYEAGRPIFFGNPKLPLDTKVAIFKSTVDPVYFNLGLWTCQGPAWTALSEGYSRLLRRLVIARWGGDQAFHIPFAGSPLDPDGSTFGAPCTQNPPQPPLLYHQSWPG